MSIISFRDLKTSADVELWAARLNREWPERAEVVAHICGLINQLPAPAPRVIELCPGHGQLAEALLAAVPGITYTGIDSSELLLQVAGERLSAFEPQVRLIQADLNADGWLAQVSSPAHAVVSMQSLHDLGGEAQVNRIYNLARQLLVPGGLFLNADLITLSGRDLPNNPGRRSISRHLLLLRAQDYERVACTLKRGRFGCCVGYKQG
jgi:hypothetical protein